MIRKYGIRYSVRRYQNLEKNYTRLPNDIFKIVTSSYQLTVYTYLCFRYNRDYQYAFPSLKTIANDTNIGITTVKKVIKELEDLKLIKILKFDKNSSRYVNNIYYIYYPVIDFETAKQAIEEEFNDMLSKEQIAELKEIEEGVYEVEITTKEEKEN